MIKRALIATALFALPAPAFAWGYQGHQVVAALARSYLPDTTKAKIDALLATDRDPDTQIVSDMITGASWADTYRQTHKETTEWHFVDVELDHPDLKSACFGFPASLSPVMAGPEKDCIVGRLTAFEKELADPKTPTAERVFALKYVLHLVGDIHQPLHASNHQDQGGNCVRLLLGPDRFSNLHSYWDTGVLRDFAPTTGEIAGMLKAKITPEQRKAWSSGDAATWAMESYEIAKTSVYAFPMPEGCDDARPPLTLPAGYKEAAAPVIQTQLEKAAVRLAWVLQRALG